MILVDSTIWIDHFRGRTEALVELLNAGRVCTHPFVVGELSCGYLKDRKKTLGYLSKLPSVPQASHAEVLELLESRRLMGQGLGWVNLHLLAASLIEGVPLWSADRALRSVGMALRVMYL